MECPQCRTQIPDDEWNCPRCRINVYWAHRHFGELAERRGRAGLSASPATPAFLISTSRRVVEERARNPRPVDARVREIARRAMRENVDP
jgi:hypothetical protein